MISNQAFEFFHQAAKTIPAYQSFLASHEFNPETIKTAPDIITVPKTDKNNYLRAYPLDELLWPQALHEPLLFCATSGSTGEPYYFPRSEKLSEQYSYLIEDFLGRSTVKDGKTLVILAFGMGVWIGGIITLRAFEIAGMRTKSPISILPTGYNKAEIFKALRKLAPNFNEVVIVGYPPFVKEIVDEAAEEDVRWADFNIRFLFAAEAFTETFRDYVCQKAGVNNPLTDTLNIYGTADIGAMAYETPLSILVRRLASSDPALFVDIFGQIEKTPTLAQYNPEFMEFEEEDGEILLTGNNALPLIRYAVGDHGGVHSFQHIQNLLEKHGIDLIAEAAKHGLDTTLQYHPFVFVYERKDLSATLQGIIIYPEYIKEALLDEQMTSIFTERFTMITKTDEDHNQYLEINLELQNNIERSEELEIAAHQVICAMLIAHSSEFSEISKSANTKQIVKVLAWPKNYETFFKPGVKQKWVIKGA